MPILEKLETTVSRVATWLNAAGCVVLIFMALLITADVLGRGLFGSPLSGTFEVVELLMGAVVGLGLAYTGVKRNHLEVEVITERMPQRVQDALSVMGNTLGLFFFAATGWKTMDYGLESMANMDLSPTTSIPTGPFIIIGAVGFLLLSVVSLLHAVEAAKKVMQS